jgi:dihydroorotase
VKLLLKNGRVIDPNSSLDAKRDVLLDKGKVVKIASRISDESAKVIDCAGLVVCPGFIDMHVHFREPGQEWKETIATGCAAAATGGFTGVACMPNTLPVNDSRPVTEMIMAAAAAHPIHVWPIGCVTKGQEGEALAEMGDMHGAGAVAFSDDGKPILSSLVMRRALEYSKIFGVPIIDHCEDSVLVDGGVMNEGEFSTRLGLRGWPGVAEDLMVQRDILLTEYTGGRVHIAHASTARAVDLVRQAKKKKIAVTCEVTPHHLVMTDEAVVGYDTNTKMNPPLRAKDDVKGLRKALADGTIDAIATDHAPHHCDEKCIEWSLAPFGIIGLETAVPVCLDRLVHQGVIDLPRFVQLVTTGPAEILGVDRGRLEEGGPADVTILDIEREVEINAEEFDSKSSNTPFDGWTCRGTNVMTIVGGRIVDDKLAKQKRG